MEKYTEANVIPFNSDEPTNVETPQNGSRLEKLYKQFVEEALKTLIDNKQNRLDAHNQIDFNGGIGFVNIAIDILRLKEDGTRETV
jgi:hypothetical protein